jgi:hypothetical protein
VLVKSKTKTQFRNRIKFKKKSLKLCILAYSFRMPMTSFSIACVYRRSKSDRNYFLRSAAELHTYLSRLNFKFNYMSKPAKLLFQDDTNKESMNCFFCLILLNNRMLGRNGIISFRVVLYASIMYSKSNL